MSKNFETMALVDSEASPRLIAFYLTQFHPVAENDLWWGKGFTEWTNVTKAMPLFESHYQPHLPTDFGFYDLRLRETRRDQIKSAKQYGIDGFCYHYYWFSGKRLLNFPLDDMLSDSESNMPFCLCWANENWTRRWDAAEHEVLIEQQYLPNDDIDFIKSLIPFFKDKRYIHVDGKPYLIVYRPQHIRDLPKTVGVWRQYCRQIGIGEIHLCAALTHGNDDYVKFGFDSGVEFPPHNLKSANINNQLDFFDTFKGNVFQYSDIAEYYLNHNYLNENVFKCIFPSWDNTARTKERALIVLNGSPDNYEFWLSSTLDKVKNATQGDQLIFINAWNEWAEGCHLEPDRLHGKSFLQATLNAKTGLRRLNSFSSNINNAKVALVNPKKSFLRDLTSVISCHAFIILSDLKRGIHKRKLVYDTLYPFVFALRHFKDILKKLIN